MVDWLILIANRCVTAAPGPALGESYVLLPTASASRSMLLMQRSLSSGGFSGMYATDDFGSGFHELGEDLYASTRYNLSLRQQQNQQQRRQTPPSRHKPVRSDGFRGVEDRGELVDSVYAVPTHADINRQVQLLTTQNAHWYAR